MIVRLEEEIEWGLWALTEIQIPVTLINIIIIMKANMIVIVVISEGSSSG